MFWEQDKALGRKLQGVPVPYTDLLMAGNLCKKNCIDQSKNFCPNEDYSGGHCCGEDVPNCPKSNICAFDNPKAPHWFKYTACPNEPVCGPKHIYPDYSGEKTVIYVS